LVPNLCPSRPPLGPKTELWRAVLPLVSNEFKMIPGQVIKKLTTSTKPKKHAFDKADLPKIDLLFIFAPFSYKYFIIYKSPSVQTK
jgi:hypothetical protein